jgi:hypothetical protein
VATWHDTTTARELLDVLKQASACTLLNVIVASKTRPLTAISRLAPARPRASTEAPVPGWKSFSQSGQVNFSRTICTTFHCRGATVETKS